MQPFTPWVWRDDTLFGAVPGAVQRTGDTDESTGADLAGYHVEATDGGIGKVDEATNFCLVVDTGPWIFGRKVLLPAGVVNRVDRGERRVYVDRSKQQIKDSPEYDPTTFDTADYRDRVGTYYSDSYRGV